MISGKIISGIWSFGKVDSGKCPGIHRFDEYIPHADIKVTDIDPEVGV